MKSLDKYEVFKDSIERPIKGTNLCIVCHGDTGKNFFGVRKKPSSDFEPTHYFICSLDCAEIYILKKKR